MTHIPATLPPTTLALPELAGLLRRLESGASLVGRVGRPTAQGSTPVQIGSVTFPLALPQPLPPGTLVKIFSKEGQVFVETQPSPAGTGASPQPTAASTGPLGAGPLPTGTAVTDPSGIVARILQSNQLPIRTETLQAFASALGTVTQEQAPLLALLLTRNLPLTPDSLAQIRERLRARGDLGREVKKLGGEVRSLLTTGQMRGSENLSRLLMRLQGLLGWDQTGPIEERTEKLKDFLMTFEEKILGRDPAKLQTDLKAMLIELDGMLHLAKMPPDQGIRASLKNVLELVEGAQLMNLPQVGRADENSWSYWRIPFPGDPNPTTVELAVRGDRDPNHPERYDLGQMEILVQIELSAMGPMRMRIRNAGDEMTLSFSVSEKRFREYLLKELPLLTETLGRAGFARVLTDVQVEALVGKSLADEIDPLQEWEKRLNAAPPSLDLRL